MAAKKISRRFAARIFFSRTNIGKLPTPLRGKYKPLGIRFSYLENAILGTLRAEVVRKYMFSHYLQFQ